jgi:hypothetical protein
MWTHKRPTLNPKPNPKIQPLKSPTLNLKKPNLTMWIHKKPTLNPKIQPRRSPILNPKIKPYHVGPQKTNLKPLNQTLKFNP